MCHGKNLFEENHKTISVFSPENDYSKTDTLQVTIVNEKPNLYPGQRLQIVTLLDIQNSYPKAGKYLGYVINYEPKCRVPYLKVKLYLKISETIQNFENKADDTFGKINIYVVDRRGINNVSVGCHVVFEGKKHPAFNDFYENCCQPSLLMRDEKTNNLKEVLNIQSLEPNKKYICALKVKNAILTNEKQKFIHDTEFTIHFTDPSYAKWIILGVSFSIILVLIVGLIILKKSQLRKKEPNNSLSTDTSQSTSTTSTIISRVSNVPIIQKKGAVKKCTNTPKTMVTQNSSTNNKGINFGQKVVGNNSNLINQTKNAPKKIATKNSNNNLINQTKNTPKKVVAKIINQNKISNVGDSVFKLK
uniref:Ig-like domain-containing protein n=1 Tax=Strongyloides papillosus TaxID=174720 RepID=A0A0N5C3M6_STREA